MNKNFKVVTINGIRGVFAAIFIVCGLIAGFIISPGWLCMKIWNYAFEYSTSVSMMNLFQGIMLWAIIALSLYALNNKRALIGFGSYTGLSPEQIRDLMEKTKQAELKLMKDMKERQMQVQNEVKSDDNAEVKDESEVK